MSENELESNREEDAIETEDKSGSEAIAKPWDPKDIRITTKTYTIREIYTQIEEHDLDLAPDFQRDFVWKRSQQIRLIESILLGIPLPAFYFNQDNLGSHQVIDGVQRLTTIKRFLSDNLELQEDDLEYLKGLEGRRFSTLDKAAQRRFGGTQIVAHVIEPQTPDDVKYDIFNRVNTGGSPLTAQEIRHCMSKTKSREFLKSLVEMASFDQATERLFWTKDGTSNLVRDNRRMSDREMALRFCAFRSVPIQEYALSHSLDAFLLDFTRRLDEQTIGSPECIDLVELAQAFKLAMLNCHEVLGTGAFRRWPPDAKRRGPLNRAVFESQAVALADSPIDMVIKRKIELRDGLRSLFLNPLYDNAVRSGTGDPGRVALRLNLAKEVVSKVLS